MRIVAATGARPPCTRLPAELGIISAKGRNGMAELLEITADEQDDRIPAAARFSLGVEKRIMPGTARVRKAGGGARGLGRGLHPRRSALAGHSPSSGDAATVC